MENGKWTWIYDKALFKKQWVSMVAGKERGVNVGGMSMLEWVTPEYWLDTRLDRESSQYDFRYPEGTTKQNWGENILLKEITDDRGTWLAQSGKHETLDLWVVSLNPMSGIETI